MGPKVSEPLSYCFFLCISCPLFLGEEEGNTAAHSGSDKALLAQDWVSRAEPHKKPGLSVLLLQVFVNILRAYPHVYQ